MDTFGVDIGNTQIKVAFWREDSLQAVHRVRTLDEASALIHAQSCTRGIVSNVGMEEERLQQILPDWGNPLVFSSTTPIPIANQYRSPQTLGLDRLAAAVGAHVLFPQEPVLIIDIGTAIKMDIVLPDEGFVGGYISPGIRIRFQSLHSFTNRLPLLEPEPFDSLIGQTTQECLLAGVMQGTLAEIEGMIQKFQVEYPFRLVFSGGDAHFFESQIKTTKFTEPNLVLIGLHRILQHNVH